MGNRTFDRESLAWAAGFFDGEGHVHYGVRTTPRGTSQRSIGVGVAQSGRERLDHLAAVLAVGNVNGPYQPLNPNAKPYHQWSASNFEAVQHAGVSIWPWLGAAKREQFARALQSWMSFTPDIAPCPHGSQRLKCTPCRSEWTRHGWQSRPLLLNVDRDTAIRTAFADGESRDAIAERFGLGYPRICQIVRS
jgi:hypothetical protein